MTAEVGRSGAEGHDQQPERPQVRELLAGLVGGERRRRDAGADGELPVRVPALDAQTSK